MRFVPTMLSAIGRMMKVRIKDTGDTMADRAYDIGAVKTGGGLYLQMNDVIQDVSARELHLELVEQGILTKKKRKGKCARYTYRPTPDYAQYFKIRQNGVVVLQDNLGDFYDDGLLDVMLDIQANRAEREAARNAA